MAVLPDPDQMRAIAHRISVHAEALRERGTALARTNTDLAWRGMAADRFHGVSQRVLHEVRGSAARLDTAAHALRRHADAVEQTVAMLHRWQERLEHTTVDLVDAVAHGADPESVVQAIGQVTGGGGQWQIAVAEDTGRAVLHAASPP